MTWLHCGKYPLKQWRNGEKSSGEQSHFCFSDEGDKKPQIFLQ